jgi:hypothetical protein
MNEYRSRKQPRAPAAAATTSWAAAADHDAVLARAETIKNMTTGTSCAG